MSFTVGHVARTARRNGLRKRFSLSTWPHRVANFTLEFCWCWQRRKSDTATAESDFLCDASLIPERRSISRSRTAGAFRSQKSQKLPQSLKPDRLVEETVVIFRKIPAPESTSDTNTPLSSWNTRGKKWWSDVKIKRSPSLETLTVAHWSRILRHQAGKTDEHSDVPASVMRDPLPHLDPTAPRPRRSREWMEEHMPRHLRDELNNPSKPPTVTESINYVIDAMVPATDPLNRK
ncbi:hypothetical protein B0H15DRAFT_841721 [Mycena belliarum]|uniref:Uncharacterized protein n=1 Tax=Mycena belliarum TaxID=1033014 RepID=A0AAD6U5M5_9AGAR|nr:hypothetical protein B0H15DRAFT_841721 [Mycena belliae]